MDAQIRKPDLWIVLDNSTSPETDWSIATGVLYEKVEGTKPIGWLRNRCLQLALENGADYIVFWDDDDYYPPTRISSGIAALEKNPDADISGSSKMYMLLTRENVFMTTGPFHENHATAATWTIRRRCAETRKFDETKIRGEEITFTKNWSVKVAQVPAEEMIVVMGHSKNTVDKSQVYNTPQRFAADVSNEVNGKMVFRARWPVPWDLWKRTFSV